MRGSILASILLAATCVDHSVVAGGESEDTGAWVRGMVQREDGSPIAGARLRLLPLREGKAGGPSILATSDSDEKGEFSLGPLRPFPHLVRLEVAAPGLAQGQMNTFVGATVAIRLRRAGTLRGCVRSAESGSPLPAASIRVVGRRTGWLGWAEAAPDGSYLLEGVPEDSYGIQARVATVGAGEADGIEVRDGKASEMDVWVAATPGLRGKVCGSDGKPIQGARVEFGGNEVTTAEDGSFRVCSGRAYLPHPSWDNEWSASASAPGFETATLKLVVPRGCTSMERTFTLTTAKEARTSGITKGPMPGPSKIQVTREGKAVAGALVSWSAFWLLATSDSGLDSTDADGTFAPSGGAERGAGCVWARTPDGFLGVGDPAAKPAGASGSFNVSVGAPVVLSGTVLGADGKPIPGATVRLFDIRRGSLKGEESGLLIDLEADSSGAWRLPWIQGRFILEAEAGSSKSVATPVQVPSSGSRPVALALVAPSVPDLIGRVVDDSGTPLEGADVSDGEGGLVTTNQDGSFRLPGTKVPLPYLRVDHPDCIGEWFRDLTPGAGGVKVVLKRGGEIRGRVVAAGDGAPVRFSWVHVQADGEERGLRGGSKWEAVHDGEGRFRIRGIPATTYAVFAVSGDRASNVVGGVSSVNGKEVRLELRPGGIVAGTARDGRGKPLPRVLVRIQATALEGLRGRYCHFETTAETDAEGSFSLVGLPEGIWKVTLPAERGFAASQRRVEVAPGVATKTDLVRAKPGLLKVHAVNPKGRSINDAEVKVETAEGVQVEPDERTLREYYKAPDMARSELLEMACHTDIDGVLFWPGLEPGTYTVSVSARYYVYGGSATVRVREEGTSVVRLVVR